MTILKSRENLSSKTPSKRSKQEPPSPTQTLPSSPNPDSGTPVLCPDTVSVSGSIRRRSLRLASKSDSGECPGEDPTPDSGSKAKGQRRFGTIEKRARVLEVKEEGVGEVEMGLEEEKLDGDKKKGARNLGEIEPDAIASEAKGEKILSVDDDLSNLVDEGGILNLRSGRKVAKRKLEGNGVDGEDKESKEGMQILSGGNGEVALDELEKESGADKNSGAKRGRRFSIEEKGKRKLGEDKVVSNGIGAVELNSEMGVETLVGRLDQNDVFKSIKGEDKEEKIIANGIRKECAVIENLEKDPRANEIGSVKGGRRFSRNEKGKWELIDDAPLTNGNDRVRLDLESEVKNSVQVEGINLNGLVDNVAAQDEVQVRTSNRRGSESRNAFRERFREVARKNASRFAHFPPEEEGENNLPLEVEREMPSGEADEEGEDWPGPFSTAMKIITDRVTKVNLQPENISSEKSKPPSVIWVPKNSEGRLNSKRVVPSLAELSMKILVQNSDAITSLENVPDILKHRLSQCLCDSRRMNNHLLGLLLHGSPSEVRVRDCSWLTEEDFTKSFDGCDARKLEVLQLDQCGRCMADYILLATLGRSPNGLPALTNLSLTGACRLSDVGLNALVHSVPALRSINLSQCSLLTSSSIDTLANSLGSSLKELYIDDCQRIDTILILPALKKLKHLEVLSLTGIQTVCDDFIREFVSVCGQNMKELVLKDCVKLTDISLKIIAETCSGLHALDLVNLCKLTDSAIGYLANNCRGIQKLKLCRNAFSDEAIAAFLETAGESLTELSLNNVKKVGYNTAISLARRSKRLTSLDLSWCRNLNDDALGLIVDSCLSLRVLKLFGCNQITNVFLDGHSNPEVKIIGLKMSPVFKHLRVPNPGEGPLKYSFLM